VSSTGKWDEYFKGRHWRVAEELTGTVKIKVKGGAYIPVTFNRGAFRVAAPGAFVSPLSTNKGRTGMVLQETDATGVTDIPGGRVAFGAPAVQKAREQYQAVW
jgi:hypothetical protein